MEGDASLLQVGKIHQDLQANERMVFVVGKQAVKDILREPDQEGVQVLAENGCNG